MMELSLEERGAYGTVIDLIYDRAGDLPDDDQFLAGWCRCDVRVWKRIKDRLVGLGKIYVEDGKLRNKRADREVVEALQRVASASEAGRASGVKRKAHKKDVGEHRGLSSPEPKDTEWPKSEDVSRKNNNLAATDVRTGVSTTIEVRKKGSQRYR